LKPGGSERSEIAALNSGLESARAQVKFAEVVAACKTAFNERAWARKSWLQAEICLQRAEGEVPI